MTEDKIWIRDTSISMEQILVLRALSLPTTSTSAPSHSLKCVTLSSISEISASIATSRVLLSSHWDALILIVALSNGECSLRKVLG
jgi:hypothetical protein